MTGAINYVRLEGRYVMKYYLVAVISIWGPRRTFNSNRKHYNNNNKRLLKSEK